MNFFKTVPLQHKNDSVQFLIGTFKREGIHSLHPSDFIYERSKFIIYLECKVRIPLQILQLTSLLFSVGSPCHLDLSADGQKELILLNTEFSLIYPKIP